jgi:hypothetical protein
MRSFSWALFLFRGTSKPTPCLNDPGINTCLDGAIL